MKDNGGPAFPQNDAEVNRINNEAGMTLRDYFAAAALTTMSNGPQQPSSIEQAAEWSYAQADAMLAERSKP